MGNNRISRCMATICKVGASRRHASIHNGGGYPIGRTTHMKITIEHYDRKYSVELPEDCDIMEFYEAYRAVCRCVWLEEQTAEIFNEPEKDAKR